MKFKIGDKVIMLQENDKVGTITGKGFETISDEDFYIVDAGENLPYRCHEKDLKLFVGQCAEKNNAKDKILEIVVYSDNKVEVKKNGEIILCYKIIFHAEVGSVPELTITQPIFNDGLTQNGEVIESANKGEL